MKNSREILKSDLYRYYGKADLKTFWRCFLFEPGFKYTYFLRKSQQHKIYSIWGIFYRFLLRKYRVKYGFQVPVRTTIGKGLFINHFGNIIINQDAKLGENCDIYPGVTIGQTFRGKSKGCPTIGDNVWIGSNAVVVGKINIGNNVLIAPNAYVNFDVPDNSIVIGNPAQIRNKENTVLGYINNVL